MALTPGRWLALLAAGGALLTVLFLPPRDLGPRGLSALLFGYGYSYSVSDFTDWKGRPLPPLERDKRRLRRIMERTSGRLEAMRLRDTVARRLTAARPGDARVFLLLIGDVPPGTVARSRAIADSLDSALRRAGPLAGRVVLAIAQGEPGGWAARMLLFPPGSITRDDCIVFVRDGRVASSTLFSLASPCVFYAAFGKPGAAVQQWLDRRGFDVATDHLWWSRPAPAEEGALNVSWWRPRLLNYMLPAGEEGWPGPRNLSLISCQAGRSAACLEGLLPARPAGVPTLLEDPIRSLATYRWDRWEPVPVRGGLLADLIHEFGRKRFEVFWRSEQPVETAFASAFGVELDRWAVGWLQGRLGRTRVGPVVHWGTVFGWLAVIFATVAVSALAAIRRQAI